MLISEFALKIDIFYNQYHYFLYYIIYAYICSNNSASAESVFVSVPSLLPIPSKKLTAKGNPNPVKPIYVYKHFCQDI